MTNFVGQLIFFYFLSVNCSTTQWKISWKCIYLEINCECDWCYFTYLFDFSRKYSSVCRKVTWNLECVTSEKQCSLGKLLCLCGILMFYRQFYVILWVLISLFTFMSSYSVFLNLRSVFYVYYYGKWDQLYVLSPMMVNIQYSDQKLWWLSQTMKSLHTYFNRTSHTFQYL